MRDALSRKDSFATLRDFWHSGTRPSLRRAGAGAVSPPFVRRTYSEPAIPGLLRRRDRDPLGFLKRRSV